MHHASQVSKEAAKVDEVFSYLRSQSEGGDDIGSNIDDKNSRENIKLREESASRSQNENTNSHRKDSADSVTIGDAVLDSTNDFDSSEPVDTGVNDKQVRASRKR